MAAPVHEPVLYDPDDAPTVARLDTAFLVEAQRPQLNNYIRHSEVGRGQHGAVYLCMRIDSAKQPGEEGRRIPVVSCLPPTVRPY